MICNILQLNLSPTKAKTDLHESFYRFEKFDGIGTQDNILEAPFNPNQACRYYSYQI